MKREDRRALLTALAVIVAALMLSAVAGCGAVARAGASAASSAAKEAGTKSCFAYQRMVEGATQAYRADRGSPPPDIAALVPGYAPKAPQCLAGGQYSLDTSGPEPLCTCSVHGHHPGSR